MTNEEWFSTTDTDALIEKARVYLNNFLPDRRYRTMRLASAAIGREMSLYRENGEFARYVHSIEKYHTRKTDDDARVKSWRDCIQEAVLRAGPGMSPQSPWTALTVLNNPVPLWMPTGPRQFCESGQIPRIVRELVNPPSHSSWLVSPHYCPRCGLRRQVSAMHQSETVVSCATCNIFGPFARAILLFRFPGYITTEVRSMADAVARSYDSPEEYLNRTDLLVLADALEEAGCADELVLEHLRNQEQHRRGCWVVESIRGVSDVT